MSSSSLVAISVIMSITERIAEHQIRAGATSCKFVTSTVPEPPPKSERRASLTFGSSSLFRAANAVRAEWHLLRGFNVVLYLDWMYQQCQQNRKL